MTGTSTNDVPPTPESLAGELRAKLSSAAVLRPREPLARRTTFRVGGPADLYAEPASEEDLRELLRYCAAQRVPVLVLGRGSNLLVKDHGVRGVVVSLSQPAFSTVSIEGSSIRCGAGVRLKTLAVMARQRAVSGFEFLEGIPGSLGGALRMNAGAMGNAIFDRVQKVRFVDMNGHPHEVDAAALHAAYRSCPGLRDRVAVSASLQGTAGERSVIDSRMRQFSEKRWSSQPAAPSAGCVFKNPATVAAGRLVDELGLKGLRVGGAVVSKEHGNFIVNDGTATAEDILRLIEELRERVWSARQIRLETEVQIVGE